MAAISSRSLWQISGGLAGLAGLAGCVTTGRCRFPDEDGSVSRSDDPWRARWQKMKRGDASAFSRSAFSCVQMPNETIDKMVWKGGNQKLLRESVDILRCESSVASSRLSFEFGRFQTFHPGEKGQWIRESESSDAMMIFDGSAIFQGVEWNFSVVDLDLEALRCGLPLTLRASRPGVEIGRMRCRLTTRPNLPLFTEKPEAYYSCDGDGGYEEPLLVRGILSAYSDALESAFTAASTSSPRGSCD